MLYSEASKEVKYNQNISEIKTLGKTKSTIELNGKIYDIHSADLLSESTEMPTTEPTKIEHHKAKKPILPPSSSRGRAKAHDRKPDRSHTLMRSALSKPVHPAATVNISSYKHKSRVGRAAKYAKSTAIKKFVVEPSEIKAPHRNHAANSHKVHQGIPGVNSVSSAVAETPKKSIYDFEEAILNATSHLQQPPHMVKKVRFKPKKSMLAASLSALLIAGFFGWQNFDDIQNSLAGKRAGFAVSVPEYEAPGFVLSNNVTAEKGKATLNYQSTSSDSSFSVVERVSSWTPEALYLNFVQPNSTDYHIYQQNGKTLYLYDGSKATWVDKGIWYLVDGKSKLTTDQLLQIANSL